MKLDMTAARIVQLEPEASLNKYRHLILKGRNGGNDRIQFEEANHNAIALSLGTY